MIKNEKIGLYGKYGGKVWVNVPAMGTQYLYDLPTKKNLIVKLGRAWINQRLAFDSGDTGGIPVVKAIGVGTGTTPPNSEQTGLVTPRARVSTVNSYVGEPDYETTFSGILTAAQINDTTEVAIFTDISAGIMIARNIHDAISLPLGSSITFNYVIGINTSKDAVGWTKTTGKTNVYEIDDVVAVGGMVEMDTGMGYKKVTTTALCDSTAGSYFHDSVASKTYIHASDDANMAASPQPHTILIISG